MDVILQDFRYAVRRLRQSPGFTVLAVVIMGLGIGANTAIFSIVNAVLFKPLPYESPKELVRVFTTESDGETPGAISYPDFLDFREREDLFVGVVVNTAAIVSLVSDEGSEVAFAEYMSADFMRVMGLTPSMGRSFSPEEDEPGLSALVAMIGYRTWQRRYDSDPNVIGTVVRLNGRPTTIVGVGPEGFNGSMVGVTSEYWMPWGTAVEVDPAYKEELQNRGSRGLFLNARLQPDVTFEQAESALQILQTQLAVQYPSNEDRSVVVMPSNDVRLHPFIDAALYPVAGLLMTVVGLVLLVACTNLANLLLLRASSRRREVAVRIAMGAKRSRLISQLLTESTLLGVLGGVAGLVVAFWVASLIANFKPPVPIPIAIDITLDTTVLGFTVLLSVMTGILFGLVPALKASRPDLVVSLKDGAQGVGGRSRRLSLRNMLVVSQVAVSFTLLIGAGLFLRGLVNAQQVHPGFETNNAAIATIDLSMGGYGDEEGRLFLADFQQRMEIHPGVQRVALTDRVPLGAMLRTRGIFIDGYELPGNEALEVDVAVIDDAYFDVMDVAVLRGRNFSESDVEGSSRVAIVSAAMAMRYWGREDVVGELFRFGITQEGIPIEIVGVARDTKVRTLGESSRPYVYLPFAQEDSRFVSLVARTDGDPAAIPEVFRRELKALDASVPLFEAKTMEEHLGLSLFAPKMGAVLLTGFGVLGLILACIGLYAVVAFSVAQRTREVGIRVALGAQHGQVVRMVIREGMALVGVGLAVGVAVGALAVRPLGGMLNGISPSDPMTFVVVSGVLAAVALLASYVPARRAARVDAMVALRTE